MRLLPALFFIFPFHCFGQNLLVNGDFEDENICTEYKVNCAPEGWIYTVPSFNYYFKDATLAHSGLHFIALIAGHATKPFYRTYVRNRLLCGLRKGNRYRLQFFIKSRHSILDSIGVYFTSYDFLFGKKVFKKIDPSVYLANAILKPVSDTNWQEVTIDYRANGDEAFITIGNFAKNDVKGPTGIYLENNYFVLFDDISFVPLDPNEKLCSNWKHTQEEIYEQNERHEFLDRMIRYNRNKPIEYIKNSPTIVQKIDTVVLPDILFETGKAEFSKTSYQLLDSICKSLSSVIIDSIVIEGHTDSVGTIDRNQVLGYNRANAVMNYIQNQISKSLFIVRSWSSLKPVADNRTAAGRQRNRRVEIYLYTRE